MKLPPHKACSKEELERFLKAYPRKLDAHATLICDPVFMGFYDFALGRTANDKTCVASYFIEHDGSTKDHKIARKIPEVPRKW